jgi:hypothetical protein
MPTCVPQQVQAFLNLRRPDVDSVRERLRPRQTGRAKAALLGVVLKGPESDAASPRPGIRSFDFLPCASIASALQA